jgi:hypothetical protein
MIQPIINGFMGLLSHAELSALHPLVVESLAGIVF